MFLGDDVDHTSDGIATIEGRGCTLHNLYLLDVVRIYQRQVVLTTIIAMQSSAVYQNQHIRVAQSVHLQMGAHIVLAKFKAGSESCQDILDALAGILLQLTMTDHLCLNRRIFQQVLCTSTCHHYFLQTVRAPDSCLCTYANSQQPKAQSQFLSNAHKSSYFPTANS